MYLRTRLCTYTLPERRYSLSIHARTCAYANDSYAQIDTYKPCSLWRHPLIASLSCSCQRARAHTHTHTHTPTTTPPRTSANIYIKSHAHKGAKRGGISALGFQLQDLGLGHTFTCQLPITFAKSSFANKKHDEYNGQHY